MLVSNVAVMFVDTSTAGPLRVGSVPVNEGTAWVLASPVVLNIDRVKSTNRLIVSSQTIRLIFVTFGFFNIGYFV